MKPRLLLLFLLAIATSALNAQIEIHLEDTGPNIAGTILEINADEFTATPIMPMFYFTNNTGSDQQFQITRVRQSVPSSWTDQLYWPTMGYNPAEAWDIYTTPNTIGNPAPTILDGTNMTSDGYFAVLRPFINPDGNNNGVGLYMYYLTDTLGNYADSIGVQVNFVLDVETKTKTTISVAPNPANSYISIHAETNEAGTITVLDVLGNVVLIEKLTSSSKTVNTESLRNGVYFIQVEGAGLTTNTQKIIIQH